jgi:hypothetical protein
MRAVGWRVLLFFEGLVEDTDLAKEKNSNTSRNVQKKFRYFHFLGLTMSGLTKWVDLRRISAHTAAGLHQPFALHILNADIERPRKGMIGVSQQPVRRPIDRIQPTK